MDIKPGTPLPWHISGSVNRKAGEANLHIGAMASPMVLASMNSCHVSTEANAAYIVHTANAYPALVEKAEALAEALETVIQGVPRKTARTYRNDGVKSKFDECEHGLRHNEACENCIDTFCEAALTAYRGD